MVYNKPHNIFDPPSLPSSPLPPPPPFPSTPKPALHLHLPHSPAVGQSQHTPDLQTEPFAASRVEEEVAAVVGVLQQVGHRLGHVEDLVGARPRHLLVAHVRVYDVIQSRGQCRHQED